jgi:glycosyltransferase involved in cell wall biosynthesis
MRVAIDTSPLIGGHAVRGIGVHTRELVYALKEESKNVKDIKIEPFDFLTNNQSLISNHYDVVHYPYFHPFFITLPFAKPANKVVVTIHDLIPLIYPKHYPPGLKGKVRFLIQRFLLRNVDGIITISETSKKDICRFLGIQPNKVHVIYLAPRKIFKKVEINNTLHIKKRYDLPERFVLYVGDLNYNKNILTLIKACKMAKIPLVICGKQALEVEELGKGLDVLRGPMDYARYLFGKPHPELSHFKELMEEFQKNKDIIRLGFVPDEDLVAIYNLATVYCQPSFYEGFGLPVLEALACGCPVVAARTQALVEIAHGAATFVDPKAKEKIAEGFKHLVINPHLSREYSWEKTAQETLAVYKEIYENR